MFRTPPRPQPWSSPRPPVFSLLAFTSPPPLCPVQLLVPPVSDSDFELLNSPWFVPYWSCQEIKEGRPAWFDPGMIQLQDWSPRKKWWDVSSLLCAQSTIFTEPWSTAQLVWEMTLPKIHKHLMSFFSNLNAENHHLAEALHLSLIISLGEPSRRIISGSNAF